MVAPPRLVLGPQQRIAAVEFPAAEEIRVTAAGLVPAPEYVVPVLGLKPGGPMPGGVHWVIRREQVSYETGGVPFMLSVAWFPGQFADAVPELLQPEPVGNPGGAVRLIEERTGRRITRGVQSREARVIKDDDREGPLLQLAGSSPVLAEVYLWLDDHDVVEYGEYVLLPGRVTRNEFTVG
jgi:DNA-binding GntR family transcriptional regulator